ncbi:hypothetical protein J1C56_02415 [Aminobacter anthyllidis]|uniref:Uncharacterized protein n=1 Tax=Aminobacter anthyllidis TaxID=1035067 RepID=A0A9X1A761_9HYPH|nr:hypothetical protein [Aminobacter anthyllidis]MBT1154438.1 hypothetical protein [Aminobacter anthyllidis]
MTPQEFRELWREDVMSRVHRDIDDSWRHGNNVTEVYKDELTGRFWRVGYQVSGDGEYHGIRELEFDGPAEVFPHTKLVAVVEYHTTKPLSGVVPG